MSLKSSTLRAAVTAMALTLSAAGPAEAETFLGFGRDQGAWNAVGRLEVTGKAFCTGALVDERLVLTAAHCLYDRDTGEPVPVDQIQFLAGWQNGRAAAYRRVRRAVAHPGYDYSAPADATRVQHDLAILELQHPVRVSSIQPFTLDQGPETGASVGVVSYAREGADTPELQDSCSVLSRQEDMVVMSCQVDFGASGAPVFSFDSGTPKIVSIVSAKAESDGAPVSLGVSLNQQYEELRAALAAEQSTTRPPGVKTVTVSGGE